MRTKRIEISPEMKMFNSAVEKADNWLGMEFANVRSLKHVLRCHDDPMADIIADLLEDADDAMRSKSTDTYPLNEGSEYPPRTPGPTIEDTPPL